MEAAQSSNGDFQNKKEQQSCVSGAVPPRTRSRVAPDWSTKESMILVNEIAAVEGECLKALSSYQKWRIVVENCIALDVGRTLNQCKSKWNSLLADYNQIKQWNSKPRINVDSYWSLQSEKRKEFGLPINFDGDLFKAIDDYVRAQKDQLDTDQDTDPEAEADLLDVIAKLGSKRQRRRLMPPKAHVEEKAQKCFTREIPQSICGEEELLEVYVEACYTEESPQMIHAEKEPQESHAEEEPQKCCGKDKPQNGYVDEKPENSHVRKKKILSMEEKEPILVEKLCKNAELIHAIVNDSLPETADFGAADLKNVKEFQTDFVRRQGDKLISYLGDIVNTLNQFPYLTQECE